MNRISLVGRVQEVRELPKVTFVTVRCRTGSQSEFLDIVLFEKQADFFRRWFKGGSWIGVTGHLKKSTREKDGKRVSELSIIADNLEMVGPPPQEPQEPQQPTQTYIQAPQPQQESIYDDFVDVSDDELPF